MTRLKFRILGSRTRILSSERMTNKAEKKGKINFSHFFDKIQKRIECVRKILMLIEGTRAIFLVRIIGEKILAEVKNYENTRVLSLKF